METGAIRRLSPHALSLTVIAALLIPGATLAQPEPQLPSGVENEPTEMLGNAPTLHAEQALLVRHDDRLEFDVRMDTPDPGSYVYPATVDPERMAPPEVFTAWAFVFNHPESCEGADGSDLCGPNDFSDDVQGGVYGVAGHVSSIDHEGGGFILDRGTDGQIVLRGEIAIGDQPWPDLPPGETTYPLSNPLGAEVHVAIAPHGQIDPATIAEELYGPAGMPGCGCWWVAFYPVPTEDA